MNTDKNKFLNIVLSLTLAFIWSLPAAAQTVQPGITPAVRPAPLVKDFIVDAKDYKLDSKLMARQMPYRVSLPKNYGSDPQARFPVIYLLHGLTGHFDNWSDKTKLTEYLTPYNFIVVMPEGDNGWFTDSATVPNDKYESYITQELIPEIDKNFRTLSDREHRAMAGLSMGGYGSLKFGLKHPEMFRLVGSFSGALGAADWTDTQFNKMGMKGAIPDSIRSVYGADDSQTRKDNDIFQMVRDVTPEKVNALPFIYQSCGTEDFLIKNNHDFLSLLDEKKIPHEYEESPGIHNWVFWDAQIQEFLRLSNKMLNKSKVKTA
ncbi:MAG: alpha/beta hydrolase [Pyrinomonadaceae bacterium]